MPCSSVWMRARIGAGIDRRLGVLAGENRLITLAEDLIRDA